MISAQSFCKHLAKLFYKLQLRKEKIFIVEISYKFSLFFSFFWSAIFFRLRTVLKQHKYLIGINITEKKKNYFFPYVMKYVKKKKTRKHLIISSEKNEQKKKSQIKLLLMLQIYNFFEKHLQVKI